MRSGPASSCAWALGPRRVASRGTIRISAATTPRFEDERTLRSVGVSRRQLPIDIATSSVITRVTGTRQPENGGQTQPAASLTHHAVDGLQHEPGQTSLVYAKCGTGRYGTTPALGWPCAGRYQAHRQSKEQEMIDGHDQDLSRSVARRARRVSEWHAHE